MSIRTWLARRLVRAAARVLEGGSSRAAAEDVDELPAGPVVMRTPAAQQMIAEAEAWRVAREAQRAQQQKVIEEPIPGSLRARIEAARARKNP